MTSFLLAAFAVVWQPHAAVRPAMECAVARLPAAEAEAIGMAMRADGPSEAQLEQAAQATIACAQEDQALRRDVLQSVIANVTWTALRRHLSARSIDMQLVDRLFDALPEEVRTSDTLMERASQLVVERLLGEGVSEQPLLANGRDLGIYLGARVSMTRVQMGQPAFDATEPGGAPPRGGADGGGSAPGEGY